MKELVEVIAKALVDDPESVVVNEREEMTQTEWGDTDELSATVYNAYASGPYSGWQVEDVTYVEFPKWQPIIVIKVGQQNVDIQYQLFYSPNGTLLRTRNVSYMDDILGPGTFL